MGALGGEELVLYHRGKLRAKKGSYDGSLSNKNSSYVRADAEFNTYSTAHWADHYSDAVHVADFLGSSSCLDVLIKNISSGQRERFSVARELESEPDVLILDETTTGIDTVTATRQCWCYKTASR